MMNTAITYARTGGWLNSPTASGVCLGLIMLTAISGRPVTGTGTEQTLNPRQHGNTLRIFSAREKEMDSVEVYRAPVENLALIREVLKPAVSDLAVAFGVSRQTIYNWINGEQVAEANANKLADLAKATEILVNAGVTINATLLKRKFANGKTLMQVVQAGESAIDAANLMVNIHYKEKVQRDRITAKFAKRKNTPATADFDLPEANDLSEGDA
ncbi:TPA: helix-turn-helix transcriptional regulator [Klebsiella pneumoniae]|uniref:helix-turn-helix domain-containing protein n=1 Tax=Enterobacteriaceae TaxID=543 RepID=UPI0007CCE535|nr:MULTISPECIES: helix-turn-helix transcriptional regulator [Enterobacteriaceae]HBT3284272.1 helix-turn-helix transcriptional regulator [Klebsiella aerogenes]EIX9449268.1 helix-turn-helix transcriptional regulator [Klebsiella pneumoniae]EIX9489862.1 helix-turn-helix transcriptional regulator [Klebsiella pneumoniae]EIX9490412.1 helix-turn-helix transcriptional regulator [Klebsiella pneumoniae]EKX2821733.1 helix-turn-helix transcriptional regulator [Klebsiella pneumoniae]